MTRPQSETAVTPCARIKVLCLSFYPPEGPSVRHRVAAYADHWREQGYDLTIAPFLTKSLFRQRRKFGLTAQLFKTTSFVFCSVRLWLRILQVGRYDLVIIHREVFPLGGAFFEQQVARFNRRLIYDLDDALWEPMPLTVNQRGALWRPMRFAAMMGVAHAVVAGNEYLASYAATYNSNLYVIPTAYVDLHGDTRPAAVSTVPIVVWIGNVGNDEYLELVRRPMERLALEFNFIFRIIGSVESIGLRFHGVEVETREWRVEREADWLRECAIGIMPLYDRDYERGKCAFKLVQYFSAGLPVVASPVGMNQDVVADGENGFLAATEEQWYQALKQLLADSALRREMGLGAYASYRQRFMVKDNAERWLEVMRDVLNSP